MPDVLGFISYGWGPGFGPWFFGPLIWIAVVLLIIWCVRGFGWRRSWAPRGGGGYYGGPPSALEILDRRFAEGDLSAEEYRERRKTLTAA